MERFRRLGGRWPWLGRALRVHARVGEVNGGPVASAVTLTAFVALFPLAVAAGAILGWVAAGDPDVAGRIIEALSLTGAAADTVQEAIDSAAASRRAATVVGVLGLLWAGSAVPAAVALAVTTPWQKKTQALRARARGLVWMAGAVVLAGAGLVGAALVDLLPTTAGPVGAAGLLCVSLAAQFGFFLWTFWLLGERGAGVRALLPGAVLGAVGLHLLSVAATLVLPRLVAGASALYGSLGVVFAILAWLALFARLLVYASTLNAVLHEDRAGTVTLEIQAPRLAGEAPVEADRGGAVVTPGLDDPA